MSELVLGDSLELLVDNRGKNPPFEPSGIPVLSAKAIKNGAIAFSEARFISQETYARWMPIALKRHDVILTSEAPLGECALVASDEPLAIAQRLYALRGKPGVLDSRYLYYAMQSESVQADLRNRSSGTTVSGIRQPELRKVRIPDPGFAQQRAIASALGTLDDKIGVNERIAATARQLGHSLFAQNAALGETVEVDVASVSSTLTRGVAPKYSENSDDLVVLNQKCIRDGRVSLTPARLTLRDKVKAPKLLLRHDVLVNSTGVGTLGRVARWTSDDKGTVDSHITIVRFDESLVDPVCAGFAMLRAQPEIEAMGEGSTGQTELRRAQLGALQIILPSQARQVQLRPKLDALEERADQALAESTALAALRDTLLPQLMSGRLRVRDAEKIVEDQV